MVSWHPCSLPVSTNRLSHNIEIVGILFVCFETPRPGFSLWLQDRVRVRHSLLAFSLGACPKSILVNYHLGRDDLGISASQVGKPDHQHSIDFGCKPDILAQLLPSVSTLASHSGCWFQVFSSDLNLLR